MNLFDLYDRIKAGLASRARNVYYRLRGVRLRGYVLLRAVEIPRNHTEIEIEAGASLDRGVVLLCSGAPGKDPKIRIGTGTYINRHSILDAAERLEIGRECAIGPGCYLTDHDHKFSQNASPLSLPLVSLPTRIEDRVWLGANVVVLKGVTIGEGTVVGAGSVVTKSLPPHCVAVGVPAQVIRVFDGSSQIPNANALELVSGYRSE
jgi:carbonic anhydrase/acetyltransferase-like protein (isoleucine patch superfamily)